VPAPKLNASIPEHEDRDSGRCTSPVEPVAVHGESVDHEDIDADDEKRISVRHDPDKLGPLARNSLWVSSPNRTRKSIVSTAIAQSGKTNMTMTVSMALRPAKATPSHRAPDVALEDQHAGDDLDDPNNQPEPTPGGQVDPVDTSLA
jgi:hypothetical protein